MNPLRDRLDDLARDVGRLRRRFESNEATAWTGVYLVERIAEVVETLDVMVSPTAADLHRAFLIECSDDSVALAEALAVVDRRAKAVRRLLGEVER